MSGLADIAIVTADALAGATPAIDALLTELIQHVERLKKTGESTSIDLRALLSQPEIEHLKATLGQGEIQASLQAFGPSSINETRVPGVWFVEHRNAEYQTIAELLMVTLCPDILFTPVENLSESRSLLAGLITNNEGE